MNCPWCDFIGSLDEVRYHADTKHINEPNRWLRITVFNNLQVGP